MEAKKFNLRLFLITLLVIALLIWAGASITHLDADITRYLPRKDPVLADAAEIFANHPIQDQLAVDIHCRDCTLPELAEYGEQVQAAMEKSNLFRKVGFGEMGGLIPELIPHIMENLPALFTAQELEEEVLRRLSQESIDARFAEIRRQLSDLTGIGTARYISEDPLGLKDLVLARLIHLAPAADVRFYRGQMISQKGDHLLMTANPVESGTDTGFARKLSAWMEGLQARIRGEAEARGHSVLLTPVGAYRAALDNEIIARRDVSRAVIFATIGIALLLVLAFPRPWMGLLAFLPALAGTAAAFFVFALIYRSVSLMAIGFGGAIISITIDHGIAYLLFLDRSQETRGKEASREIRAVGLMAALTTMGAFSALYISDFPILEQLGLFTALGIGFSFLFVHSVFPRIFPVLPAAAPRSLPLQGIARRLAGFGKKGALAALLLAAVLLLFAKPVFRVDLSAMNTVSKEAKAAEEKILAIWGGGMFEKVYLMAQGESIEALQERWDNLLLEIEAEKDAGRIASGFIPSMIFPGDRLREKNLAAWKAFWTRERIMEVKEAVARSADSIGFTADAFEPFFRKIEAGSLKGEVRLPEKFFPLFGIKETGSSEADDSKTGLTQFSAFTPGEKYRPETFYEQFTGEKSRIFDPVLFTDRLGKLLFSTFLKMLGIIGLSVAVLIFFFFLDLRLTAIALLPVIFALICTLGTLKLLGHPLDIPGLMLGIIVFGMGIDYSLFMVRSHQRYKEPSHPNLQLIRTAVFMASASTLIGFGSLGIAQHSLLKSAGLTSFVGIAYALIGAFLILPPLLERRFSPQNAKISPSASIEERVLLRYRDMEPIPRLFARFKMRLDPMFNELPEIIERCGEIRTLLDIGCGYGVPACWILERLPEAKVYGMDPDQERVRVASEVIRKRGRAYPAGAPEIPRFPEKADAAFMLDMCHYLNDEDLKLTLFRLKEALEPGGCLILRAVIPPPAKPSKLWRLYAVKQRLFKEKIYHRSVEEFSEMIRKVGFLLKESRPSGKNPESAWFIAENLKH